jgi:Cu(I)/Ag(I) efflux system protein CusF
MLRIVLLPIAFLIVACSQPADPAKSEMSGIKMDESASPAAAGPIRSTGTVTAVNAAAGTITLRHEPIPAIRWSAMTMEFHAEDPAILQGIAVGDRVAFELKSAAEPNTVTMVQEQ